jgi:predicted secreted protein
LVLALVATLAVGLVQGSGEELEDQVDDTELVDEHTEQGERVLPWAIAVTVVAADVTAIPVLARRRPSVAARNGHGWSGRSWSAADARGGRVVFLSHCLLNENVRFPGGATCPGVVPELGGYVADGVGIYQMPCPEQRAWGGVRKRHLLRLYGCAPLRWRLVRRPALAVATAWTTVRYRRLARRIACDIADYRDSGFEVVEIVGVGGSPSCGVATTLDLDGAVAALARGRPDPDRRTMNRDVVAANVVAGRGLFVTCLDRALRARGVTVTYREHDLIAELHDAGAIAP